jgi:hypothetical protein
VIQRSSQAADVPIHDAVETLLAGFSQFANPSRIQILNPRRVVTGRPLVDRHQIENLFQPAPYLRIGTRLDVRREGAALDAGHALIPLRQRLAVDGADRV